MQQLYIERISVAQAMKKTIDISGGSAPADSAIEPDLNILRPGLEIRTLRNMTNRYLTATRPAEADTATGGNTPILMFLIKHRDEEIFQYDIEKRFGIARSTASRVLGLMEKKGLIERKAVDRDARLRRIVLTDKAIPITEVLYRSATEMEKVMLRGFSEQDQHQLLSYFELMRENLIATGNLGDSYAECADPLHPQSTQSAENAAIAEEKAADETNEEEGKSEK